MLSNIFERLTAYVKMKLFSVIILLLFYQWCYSQSGSMNQHDFIINASATNAPVTIDGDLNEPGWQSAETINKFFVKFPQDTGVVKNKTTVKVIYDKNYLYIGAECYDEGNYIVQSLKRDAGFFDNDIFSVVLDPVNQQANGYLFGVSPMNIQYDDLLSATNLEPQDFSYDNKWFSEVKRLPGKWVVEMAIPFKILRFTKDKKIWGINFLRNDLKSYQYTTWAKIPVQLFHFDLGYTGALLWPEPPPEQKNNFVVSPYATGSVYKPEDKRTTYGSFDAGFDAKVALSSSLNLDITVNPDFSQVEVDQQQINLTRYNIFLPEKRTFFLENNDLFFNIGNSYYRPFYSRTIGLDPSGGAIPIVAGLRLTGNVTNKLRMGIMNMQTRSTENYKAQNYSAVAINHRVMERSLFKAYFTNRQAIEHSKGKYGAGYGRNAGSEFTFNSRNGTWQAWLAGNWSFKEGFKNNNQFYETGVAYTRKRFSTTVDIIDIGSNYFADMGFVSRIDNYDKARDTTIRIGFKEVFNYNDYTIRVNKKHIQFHRFLNENIIYWNQNGSFSEGSNRIKYILNFTNTSELSIGQSFNYADVLIPFSFFSGNDLLPAGRYQYTQTELTFKGDNRKPLYWSFTASAGSFYNGNIKSLQTTLRLRKQPWGNFSMDVQWNDLHFPGNYGKSQLVLVRPKIEISFSNKLFWTTFLQYGTQQENFNINSRLQYRFKPMSDIYLVYTDNYYTNFPEKMVGRNRDRAIVLKVNYWLNL